jgi:Domain of unknown function (DUF4864)
MSDSFLNRTSNDQGPIARPPSKPSKKSTPSWFKILFTAALIGVFVGIIGVFLPGGMSKIVEEQLELLREGRLTQAYYEYTSRDFQNTTSLEDFRQFLSFYRVLADNKSFRFEGSGVKDGVGTVSGVLISQDLHEMNAEFQLVKEENKWKIQSIRLKETAENGEGNRALHELTNAVQQQMKSLQKDEILDVYYNFLSKDFQKETPFQVFQDYVASNPILTSFKNVIFKNSRIEDGKAYVDLVLSSEAGDFLIEYKLIRENAAWKVFSLRLVLPPEEAVKTIATNPQSLAPPVHAFLNALLFENIEKAYFNTAKEFQEVTSLSAFESFVLSHPAFSHRDLADIKTGIIENGAGKLRVNLHDSNGMTVLEFKLGYEEGQWRIWGITVIDSPENTSAKPLQDKGEKLNHQSLAEKLIVIIERKLAALKHQDFIKAYYNFFTQDYQDKHTLAEFENLIESIPVLWENRDADFDRMEQDGPFITLKGRIRTFNYKTYPIKYQLIKEYGSWKINNFELLKPIEEIAEATPPEKESKEIFINESEDIDVPNTDIKKITVGSEVDERGMITTPRIVIDSDTELLYINVDIEDALADSMITAFLTHVDSGSEAPPLSTKLLNDGNTVVSFAYASPKGGWPEGNYVVKVTTSTEDEQLQRFQMRKGEKKFY